MRVRFCSLCYRSCLFRLSAAGHSLRHTDPDFLLQWFQPPYVRIVRWTECVAENGDVHFAVVLVDVRAAHHEFRGDSTGQLPPLSHTLRSETAEREGAATQTLYALCFVASVSLQTLQQAVSTDTSEQAPQTVHELNSLISALVSVIGVAVGTPLSGCFMNPFFGLAVLAVSHWRHSAVVVIFGPTLGAAVAALAAKLFTYRTRAPFLTGVRWGAGGMGGLGLGNLQPQALATFADSRLGAGSSASASPASAGLGAGGSYGQQQARANPFNPSEEKQGSRF